MKRGKQQYRLRFVAAGAAGAGAGAAGSDHAASGVGGQHQLAALFEPSGGGGFITFEVTVRRRGHVGCVPERNLRPQRM